MNFNMFRIYYGKGKWQSYLKLNFNIMTIRHLWKSISKILILFALYTSY